MNDTAELDFPPIVDPAPATAVVIVEPAAPPAVATIKAAAVAYVRAQEPAIVALADKFRGVALDLSTPKALSAGRAARAELRESGRYLLQRNCDLAKDLLNDSKRDVIAETDRLIGIVRPVEDHIHAQIEARETVLAAEKAERDRIEGERKARIEAEIALIASYPDKARGKDAKFLEAALNFVYSLKITKEQYAEFSGRAQATLDATIEAVRRLAVERSTQDQELARIETLRIENERVAAEQAERQRVLDEQAADLKRQAAALEAQRKAAEEAQRRREQAEAERLAAVAAQEAAEHKAESDRLAAVERELARQADVAEIERNSLIPAGGERDFSAYKHPDGSPMYSATTFKDNGDPIMLNADGSRSIFCDIADDMPDTKAADRSAEVAQAAAEMSDAIAAAAKPVITVKLDESPAFVPVIEEPATVKLGDLCKMLGFTMTQAFVADTLGIIASIGDKRAVLYRESQRPLIKAALIKHIEGVL